MQNEEYVGYNSFEDLIEPEKDLVEEQEESRWISDYGLSIAPNDFNVSTLFSLISRGKISIPHFQRSFVWKKRQSSKLIESLILNLPVPQIYLYQNNTGELLIIDGQQRLLSIFLFIAGKFPKENYKSKLGTILKDIDRYEESLSNETEFLNFSLDLPNNTTTNSKTINPLHGCNYKQLNFDDNNYKDKFDLATIRTIIIKQTNPTEESPSSMYEIFNRLNTGGTKLNTQEIRASLYYSSFFDMVKDINSNDIWRNTILGMVQEDNRLNDIEIIFRGFALMDALANKTATNDINYKAPMTSFINNFCEKAKNFDNLDIDLYRNIFLKFAKNFHDKPKPFHNRNQKFTVAIFDAIFACLSEEALKTRRVDRVHNITLNQLEKLKNDEMFKEAILEGTASFQKVKTRITKAQEFLLG